MSRTLFTDLRSYLRCSPTVGHARGVNDNGTDIDPRWTIRDFVDAFNKCRAERVKPGRVLVVDELMSMWYGLDS